MKQSAKFAAFALSLAMLSPIFAACAKNDTSDPVVSDTTVPPIETTTVETTTGRKDVKDGVPEGLSFNGAKVRVLYRGNEGDNGKIFLYDVVGTDNAGEVLSDAVWERNRTVEERLTVTFAPAPTNVGDEGAVRNMILNLILSGSDEYDYIVTTGGTNIYSGLNSSLRDLSNLPYADFSQPWWWDDMNQAVSLDGKAYQYIFGDSLIAAYIYAGVVFYNKALYENVYGDPDAPYALVTDGNWTIDTFKELVAGAYKDVNGNGIEDEGDTFGAIKSVKMTEEVVHFMGGFDINMYHRDENGHLLIDFDQARSVTAIDELGEFFNSTAGVFHSAQTMGYSPARFGEGNILFFPGRMNYAMSEAIRNMEDPYGILPYPKLNAEQEEYVTIIHDSSTNMSVPKTVNDERFQLVGAVLEAVNAESWREVMPIYLETIMKQKYSQDEMSGKVIDIVVGGLTKNILYEYRKFSESIIDTCLYKPAIAGENTFASSYVSARTAAQNTWNTSVKEQLGVDS